MMAVDTSALLAILLDEPEKTHFEEVLAAQAQNIISSVNVHEAMMVVRMRQGRDAVATLWALLNTHTIEIIPFDEAQVRAAAEAFERFGKGIHAKARLNLCDCATYALARTRNVPLLFKGDDFPHTDIVAAV